MCIYKILYASFCNGDVTRKEKDVKQEKQNKNKQKILQRVQKTLEEKVVKREFSH